MSEPQNFPLDFVQGHSGLGGLLEDQARLFGQDAGVYQQTQVVQESRQVGFVARMRTHQARQVLSNERAAHSMAPKRGSIDALGERIEGRGQATGKYDVA